MYLNPNAGYTALLYVRSINNFRIEGIKRSIHYHLEMTNDKISRVSFFVFLPPLKHIDMNGGCYITLAHDSNLL